MIYHSKKRLYLELALYLNSELYKEKCITLYTYEKTQKTLLKRIETCDKYGPI